MPYKEIYKEEWESEGVKGKTNIQDCFTCLPNHKRIAIRHTVTPKNEKYGAILFFPSYPLIRELIRVLAEVHSKEEVERELGIKIGGKTNGRKRV